MTFRICPGNVHISTFSGQKLPKKMQKLPNLIFHLYLHLFTIYDSRLECIFIFSSAYRITKGWLWFGWTSTQNIFTKGSLRIVILTQETFQSKPSYETNFNAKLSNGSWKMWRLIYQRNILLSSRPILAMATSRVC